VLVGVKGGGGAGSSCQAYNAAGVIGQMHLTTRVAPQCAGVLSSSNAFGHDGAAAIAQPHVATSKWLQASLQAAIIMRLPNLLTIHIEPGQSHTAIGCGVPEQQQQQQ
jgi:hypothetical protein